MALAVPNFAVIIITIFVQLIYIKSDIVMPPVVTEPEGSFRLGRFIDVNIITTSHCIDDIHHYWEVYHTGLHTREWALVDSVVAEHCGSDQFVMDWNADDLGFAKDRKDCSEMPINIVTRICDHCICVRKDMSTETANDNSFSLLSQESDSVNNKVVTGLRFHLDRHFIHLQIQHATLLPNGKLDDVQSFKEVGKFEISGTGRIDDKFIEGTHYRQFNRRIRTLFLDEIFVPAGYVVTGVKFADIENDSGFKGLKMMVKGTRYGPNYKLDSSTDQWFDYRSSAREGTVYNHDRTELDLPRCKSTVSELVVMSSTNHFVQFKETSINDGDTVMGAHPRFSNALSENLENRPLRGLGLSLQRTTDCSSDLITRAFVRESFVSPTSPASITTTIGPTIVTAAVTNDLNPQIIENNAITRPVIEKPTTPEDSFEHEETTTPRTRTVTRPHQNSATGFHFSIIIKSIAFFFIIFC